MIELPPIPRLTTAQWPRTLSENSIDIMAPVLRRHSPLKAIMHMMGIKTREYEFTEQMNALHVVRFWHSRKEDSLFPHPAIVLLLLCCAKPAYAKTPPLLPCNGMNAYFSISSLVDIIETEKSTHERDCAVNELRRFGRSAMPYWVAILNHRSAELRGVAAGQISRLADHGEPVPIEQPGFPRSAIVRYIEVAAMARLQTCGSETSYVSDAGVGAVPLLISLLADKNEYIRSSASACLGKLGPQAASAVPHMLARINTEISSDHSYDKVLKALNDLAKVGIYSVDDFIELVNLLQKMGHGYGIDRQKIALFSTLPPSIVPWLQERIDAAKREIDDRTGKKSRLHDRPYDWLLVALSNTRSAEAASILIHDSAYGDVPNIGAPAIPLLLSRLTQTADLDEKTSIVRALNLIATPEAKQAVRDETRRILPALIADLKQHNHDYDIRKLAGLWGSSVQSVERFRMLGPATEAAREDLMAMLDSSDVETRSKAAIVLGYVQAFEAESKLVSLRDASRAPDDDGTNEGYGGLPETRVFNRALAQLQGAPGYMDSLSVARLTSLALDGEKSIRDWTKPAVTALARRGPAIIPELLTIVDVWSKRYADSNSSDTDRAKYALAAIAGMGKNAAPAFATLVTFLNDPELGYTLAKGDFPLYQMGIRTKEGMRLLFDQVVNNKLDSGRWYSAIVLGKMGPTPEMLKPLRTALQQPELWTYGGAPPDELYFAVTGKHVSSNQSEIRSGSWFDNLAKMLRDADSKTRQLASDMFGSLGSESKMALPHLIPLLRDESPLVRRVTSENIGRIAGNNLSVPERINYLLEAVNSDDDSERHAALAQLTNFDRLPASGFPTIKRTLSDSRMREFQEPLLRLAALSGGKAAVDMLMARLEAANTWAERDMTVEAFVHVGPAAIPALLKRSRAAKHIDLQIALASALAKLKTHEAKTASAAIAERLLPIIAADLSAPDTADTWHLAKRRQAAQRLTTMMAFSGKARDMAAGALADSDPHIRFVLFAAVGEYGFPEMLPLLTRIDTGRPNDATAEVKRAIARIRARHDKFERWQRCVKDRFWKVAAKSPCEQME